MCARWINEVVKSHLENFIVKLRSMEVYFCFYLPEPEVKCVQVVLFRANKDLPPTNLALFLHDASLH